MKRKKEEFIDDGRVIAPMNVDGMPWYVPKNRASSKPEARAHDDSAGGTNTEPIKLTRDETLALTWGVLKAALLAALVFAGGLYLFILFCTQVWFK